MADLLKQLGAECFHLYELCEFEMFGIRFNFLQIAIWTTVATILIHFFKRLGD